MSSSRGLVRVESEVRSKAHSLNGSFRSQNRLFCDRIDSCRRQDVTKMTEERSAEHVQLKQLNGGEDKNIAATENTSEETRLHRDSGHSSSSVAGSETAASAAHSAPVRPRTLLAREYL